MTKQKAKTDVLELFSLEHTGTDFYYESGTIMSSIYEVGNHTRSDWGQVLLALRQGMTVNIRPANAEEELWARRKHAEIQKRSKKLREEGIIS